MGWVKQHLAHPGEDVRGIIIAGENDERIRYAVAVAPNVTLYSYRVQFELVENRKSLADSRVLTTARTGR